MATTQAPAALRFRGLPEGVECIAPIVLPSDRNRKPQTRLTLNLGNSSSEPNLRVYQLGVGLSRLWFPLPPYTAPGSYSGEAVIDDSHFSVTVEVDENEHLVLSPPELKFAASAGDQQTTTLTLANVGNVVCTIGKGHAFGLFDVEGAERAVGASLRDDTAHGREKMDRLMDRMAEEHAGFVRVMIEEGDGPIAPGDVRQLQVRLRFPDNMKPGRIYTGTWVLFNLAYQIRVSARGEAKEAQ
jgi:hypothetical protein